MLLGARLGEKAYVGSCCVVSAVAFYQELFNLSTPLFGHCPTWTVLSRPWHLCKMLFWQQPACNETEGSATALVQSVV